MSLTTVFQGFSNATQAMLSPITTIDVPPSCCLVRRVHYTELDVTQIRAHVRPHTALLLSYLCEAPL